VARADSLLIASISARQLRRTAAFERCAFSRRCRQERE